MHELVCEYKATDKKRDMLSLFMQCSQCDYKSTDWSAFKKMSECQTKAGNQKCFVTLSHSQTLTLSHSLIQSLSTCWTTFVFMSMLESHSHTLTLPQSLILSFTLSRLAEQLLFSCLGASAQVDGCSWSTFLTMPLLILSWVISNNVNQDILGLPFICELKIFVLTGSKLTLVVIRHSSWWLLLIHFSHDAPLDIKLDDQ